MSDPWVSALLAGAGEERAGAVADFVARLPPGYVERVSPSEALVDLAEVSALEAAPGPEGGERPDGGAGPADGDAAEASLGGAHRLVVRADPAGGGLLRLRRYGWRSVELSSWLPVLESFGLVVVEAVPMVLGAGPGGRVHIDDFGLRLPGVDFDPVSGGSRLVAAVEAVTGGLADVDGLNRLVAAAGLGWRQVVVLRAYRRYRTQTATALTAEALDAPLVTHPEVTAALVAYFEARFDPAGADAAARAAAARAEVVGRVAGVGRLEDDVVLRGLLALIDATVRTSFFKAAAGGPATTVTFKFDSAVVPDLPTPRPMVETWVHGPEVEGVHLRFGRIARGGIRWSERRHDLRTEVLGLADAQKKKNAIIVPTGAKGGFVARRGTAPAEVAAAYVTFISSLLDVTDNLVDGAVVHPDGVVVHDVDDPYLVVAADRGTATFSDLANDVARRRGFWLGDAFASGGSHGYDHKAMGITARGAWVAVRRHFHQLDIDADTEAISVVGIGDMSGDVFGNGMLRSPALRLVAAFDHRHVFLDPDPDPAAAFAERRRLAGLGRSSWDDYDRRAISAGGGVWSRQTKSVPLDPAVRRALGTEADELAPPALISAMLTAPVDLLWFGGIGTYVRAPDETDAEAGDAANDAVRVTADRVRARVIAEGGNLGVTQRARIRYSRRGGRINADFIDNAAGVATSDREVNLKILLGLAEERGRLDGAGRDELLRRVEGYVAADVLRAVDHSVGALNRAVPVSAAELDAHEALLDDLEAAGTIDRGVEDLPDAGEWTTRREAGAGLIRPELAVLLAAAKSELAAAVEASALPAEGALRDAVAPYFAPEIRERFGDLIPAHRLYPQLVATDVAGEIVDRMGIVWAHELAAELDVDLPAVAAAFWAARQVLAAGALWDAIEEGGATELTAEAESAAHHAVADAVGMLGRTYLLHGGDSLTRIATDRAAVDELAGGGGAERSARRDGLAALGVPSAVASRVAALADLALVGEATSVAGRSGRSVAEVVEVFAVLDAAAGTAALRAALRRGSRRWAAWSGRAVLDDLDAWRSAAALGVLRSSAGSPAGPAASAWVQARPAPFARIAGVLRELQAGTADALAVAPLVARWLPEAAPTPPV